MNERSELRRDCVAFSGGSHLDPDYVLVSPILSVNIHVEPWLSKGHLLEVGKVRIVVVNIPPCLRQLLLEEKPGGESDEELVLEDVPPPADHALDKRMKGPSDMFGKG